MPVDSNKVIRNVTTLKINKLTEEQYQQALAEGLINEDEIYITPSAKIPDYVLTHDGNGNATIEGMIVVEDGDEVVY